MKPVIAITARERYIPAGNRVFGDNESYFRYVEAAGGIPMLSECTCLEDARVVASRCDGLIVSGGPDVNPALYGEENNGSYPMPEDLENSDLLLYRAFKEAGKPVLAICRGIQIVAAAEGAALIQDIPTFYGTQHTQSQLDPPIANYLPLHDVTFTKGTRLHAIFGDSYGVNSFHHQCLKEVPAGFVCAATAAEGFAEAIEKEHVIGVQWHPERMLKDPKHLQIAITFIEDCKAVSAR